MLPALNEAAIKAIVIDHLFEKGMLRDAVLINEMVIANWSRRADLAVANGRLTAFEIKSDLDTLSRLDGQVETYLQRFDKVVIVTTEKFYREVMRRTPDSVGVWILAPAESKQGYRIRVARPGRATDVKRADALCGFLLRTELSSFLRSQGIAIETDYPRATLTSLAGQAPASRLRAFVLEAIKKRYQNTFSAFVATRQDRATSADLSALSKAKLQLRRYEQQKQDLLSSLSDRPRPRSPHARSPNIEAIARVIGSVPEGMPAYILGRRKRCSA
ncbi:sce7726 family protein [Ralstonia solanacearum]|uniref:sce7726 family protein n=1 Tax=Ralstonia solanacearum TaxID=305 RepID=UPI0001D94994|nr:sce7726 family protein [Ralstonia solanacearum]CBJ49575.1 putative phage-related protein, protein cII [Ralstonia solanacearum PSI07]